VQSPNGVKLGHTPVGDPGSPIQDRGTGTHIIKVDLRSSMKAATEELEVALDRFGANLDPSSRRATALLATELVAQVVGRDPDYPTGSVDLRVTLRPGVVRLETCGTALHATEPGLKPGPDDCLAEWGHFLLDRLADRWGIDSGDPPILWAEVELT
jgi:hypothetical protein